MAALKSETLSHYYEQHGVPLRARAFGHVRALNRVGAALAPLANWVANAMPVRMLAERFGGIDRRRALPRFQRETLQRWFRTRRPVTPVNGVARRGPVIFLADSFTSYTEPEIGRAAIELLEMAGWNVHLAGDVCCGRALISKGLLDDARARHAKLVSALGPAALEGTPIVGCEPSCVFTLRDELPDLARGDAAAVAVGRQARMVDDLLAQAIDDGSLTPNADSATGERRILFHGHCHQKALIGIGPSVTMLKAAGYAVQESGAGCCGMAGSFGYEAEHYDVSRKIGEERLFPAVAAATRATISVAGVSCRQQIEHFTDRKTKHIAEVLAERIAPGHVWRSPARVPEPVEVEPTPESTVHARNTGEGPA